VIGGEWGKFGNMIANFEVPLKREEGKGKQILKKKEKGTPFLS